MNDLSIRRPDVPADLTEPDGRYRMLVGVVLGALGLFVAVYVALIGISLDQLRLSATLDWSNNLTVVFLGGLFAAALLSLLVSGLFGPRRGSMYGVRVDPATNPKLLAFVHDIADSLNAPRPKEIYLTPDVNAAVTFHDNALSLIFPTQKNLIIGLGLVNALTLDELKAVLAHEFGHFSQSSMRLGTYVYVSTSIIGRILGHRSWVDAAVARLQADDLRLAWLGYLVGTLVWAVRSVLETLFLVIALPNRALTRQMEFHADKVAVSLTGSDSLIHALSKLGFADRALLEAHGEVAERIRNGRAATDLFAHQTAAMDNLRRRDGNPALGTVPERPRDASGHRLFRDDDEPLLQMWSTHPPREAREDNAKSPYYPSHLDDRPGWVIFDDQQAAREAVTAFFLAENFDVPPDAEPDDDTTVGAGMLALEPRYVGLYQVTNIALTVGDPDDLLPEGDPDGPFYDDELAQKVRERNAVSTTLNRLLSFCHGTHALPPGGLRLDGRVLDADAVTKEAADQRDQLAMLDEILNDEAIVLRGRVHARAGRRGPGWAVAHAGAVDWVHYTQHVGAQLAVLRSGLDNIYAFLQEHEINAAEVRDITEQLSEIRSGLLDLLEDADDVDVPPEALPSERDVRETLHVGAIPPEPAVDKLEGAWLAAFHKSFGRAQLGLGDLHRAAMDYLLHIEAEVLDDPYGDDCEPYDIELPDYPVHPIQRWSAIRNHLIPHPENAVVSTIRWQTGARSVVGLGLIAGLLWARWSLTG